VFDGCKTSYAVFWRAVKTNGPVRCLGARGLNAQTGQAGDFVWQSYREVGQRVHNLAAALKALGLEPKARVGLYAPNRPEWILGEQAAFANNLITVPLYDTLGPESAEQIVSQATLSAVICSPEKVPSLVEIAARHSCLRLLVVMPPQPFEAKPAPVRQAAVPTPATLRIVSFAEAEKLGAQNAANFKHIVPAPADFATFCFTRSGIST
jgi:long-chain acyl-CoA synthetase